MMEEPNKEGLLSILKVYAIALIVIFLVYVVLPITIK